MLDTRTLLLDTHRQPTNNIPTMSKTQIDSSEFEKLKENMYAIMAQLTSIQIDIATIKHQQAYNMKMFGTASKAPAKTVTTPAIEQQPIAETVTQTQTVTETVTQPAAAPQQKPLNVKLYFNNIYDGQIKHRDVELMIANAKNAMIGEEKKSFDALTASKQRDAIYNVVKQKEEYVKIHEAYKKGTVDNTAKNE